AELARLESLLPGRFEAPFHRARALLLLGRTEEARAALRSSLARRPGFAPAKALLAEVEGREGGEAEPAGPAWGRHWTAAHRAFRERRWEEAARAYGEMVRLEERGGELFLGSAVETRLGRGIARLEAGDRSGAAQDFAAAAALWPRFLEPALLLAVACHRDGRAEVARRAFEEAYERAPSRDEAAFWIVASLRLLGDHEEALRWTAAIERDILREQARTLLLIFSERWREAAEAGRRAVERWPEDALCHALRALALVMDSWGRAGAGYERDVRAALESARRARDLRPESAVAHAVLGLALQSNEGPARATAAMDEALRLDPDHWICLYAAGWVARRQGRFQEEKALFRRGAEQARARGLRFEEAVCRLNAVDFGNPRAAGDELLRINAAWPLGDACMNLGFGYNGWLRDPFQAEAMFRRALELAPARPRRYGDLARALEAQGKYAEALAAAEEGLRMADDRPDLHNTRGRALEGLGRHDDALQSYLRSLELALDPTPLQYDRGRPLAAQPLLRLLQRFFQRPGKPGGDPRLDPLGARLLELGEAAWKDPALASLTAMVLLRAPARRDPAKALELARRAAAAAKDEDDLRDAFTTLAAALRETGEPALAIRTLEDLERRAGARRRPEEMLAAFRAEAEGRFVSYATVDARWTQRGSVAAPRVASGSADAEEKRAARYFQARLLAEEGRLEEAERAFRELADEDPARPEPLLRAVECLLGREKAAEAEAYLRGQLVAKRIQAREAWERWSALCFADLSLGPGDVFARLGGGPYEDGKGDPPACAADLRWLLERLAAGPWFGILCGSKEDREVAGRPWSRDRFFAGGSAARGPAYSDPDLTREEALYQGLRRFVEPELRAGYRIPLPRGAYRVALHLSVARCPAPGERTAELEVESQPLASCAELKLDLATACRRSCEVAVSDGTLNIDIHPGVSGIHVAAIEIERRE
ncbi:MAG: tetratricopeptide repeat protein, partial [Planctomycetes bacterium]|nr:tetratricopeptide repeat protein [Planctomycetota bacterium]